MCGRLGYASATARGWSTAGQNPNLETGVIHGAGQWVTRPRLGLPPRVWPPPQLFPGSSRISWIPWSTLLLNPDISRYMKSKPVRLT